MAIAFHISYDKAIEAIAWLANKKPGIDIYHVAKVLFFAEKEHVNCFARPILGDKYVKLPFGPAPSSVVNLISSNDSWLSPLHLEKLEQAVNISSKADKYQITPKRAANTEYFSSSDLDCLEKSLTLYGDMSFDDLYNLTHAEKCYILAEEPAGQIDYALMVDDNNPHRIEILNHMREVSKYITV